MKVLIVNTSDTLGGAGRAAYRLHKSLLSFNIDSLMLVQHRSNDDETIIGPKSRLEKVINLFRSTLDNMPLLLYQQRIKTPFSPSILNSNKLLKRINDINADVVHLHWINNGMLRIEDIAKIKSPIVWSLHDNWAFTGGCHIKWECEKYISNCGACPLLKSRKRHDLSRNIWKRKKRVFSKLNNFTIIGLSRWMYICANSSSLLKNKNILHLPNSIDTKLYKPLNKLYSRFLWNLPDKKKLVLISAINAISDVNKGFKELVDSLQNLVNNEIELVIFGSSNPKFPLTSNFITHYQGILHDDASLISLYSASDVMVLPSLHENLSLTIMEALSCGLPVVAFDTGGNSDLIEHKKNGYLANPYDTKDFALGIEWILGSANYNDLCKNARTKIQNEFDNNIIVNKYIELYKIIQVSKLGCKHNLTSNI